MDRLHTNPVTGCTKISDGCKNCYAEKMHNRLRSMGVEKYQHPFNEVHYHLDELEKVYKIKKPRKIFIGSMADIFHDYVPFEAIRAFIRIINDNPQHIFQILTKRVDRMKSFFCYCGQLEHIPKNLWAGVTVCNRSELHKIETLKYVPFISVKFIFFEPLLEDVGEIDLTDIDWVIVGGETGAGAREMIPEWAFNIYEQCVSQNVPFFFKQWGSLKITSIGSGIWINGIFHELREFKQFPKTKAS